MPLKPGKDKETIHRNIEEMVHSSTFARGKSKAKKVEMAQAAALREAGIPKKAKKAEIRTKTKSKTVRGKERKR